jgi:undecaprenyl pyrophosphate phosphatase UppP
MLGFVIIAICALVYTGFLLSHQANQNLKNITYSIAFVGLIIYVFGRILVYLDNNSKRRQAVKTRDYNKDPV